MLVIALVLLVIVFIFAFVFLIPKGKEYRIERLAMKKELQIRRTHQEWYDETYAKLQQLRSEHKHVIEAYDNSFDPERFIKMSENCFESLKLSKQNAIDTNSSEFSIYEVNATSQIDSPQNFYTFIEQVNKSNWIVKVNFPIHFEREGNLIRSSFNMRVYSAQSKRTTRSNEALSLNK
jgi:cellobiose phosphorylase